MSKLNITPTVLKHYVENSNIPLDFLREKAPHLDSFISGERQPTFNQLSNLAKMINVPTGLLVLPTAVEKEQKHLEFRTLGSLPLEAMSVNLRQTIDDMDAKQDFLKEELENKLSFVGSINQEININQAVENIRQSLKIEEFWQADLRGKTAFNFFREKVNQLGIAVFINGVVGQNNTRPLDVEEFRGFSLVDEKAPLIFINSKDSKNGQLFTLIHEVVHIFLGMSGISSSIEFYDEFPTKAEQFANKVTAELLVPEIEFLKKVSENSDISALAHVFKVSESVILRRLLTFDKLTKEAYQEQVINLKEKYKLIQDQNKKDGGGNYHNTVASRIDNNFFRIVRQAIHADKLTYTKAFEILGVGYKGYKSLEASLI